MISEVAVHRPMALDATRSYPAAQRILIVDPDPKALDQLAELMVSYPVPIEPIEAGSVKEALRILASGEDVDCLLVDVSQTAMDGFHLLISARELRKNLRIIATASALTPDLHQAALESGASRVLAKPFDFEDLLVSLAASRPGSVSYLEGALGLMDVCRLSAACQPEGGLRVRQGRKEGVLAHYGTTLVHAEADGQTGAAAFASLRGWSSWHFESLSLSAVHMGTSCKLEMTGDVRRPEGARASGYLRGLTLRHLIEWAMRARQTCTLTVTSQGRTGVLSFDSGRILNAETLDRDGGRAAAEILSWENVLVKLNRPATVKAAAPAPRPKGEGMEALIDRFCGEIEGWIATSVVRRLDGTPVCGRSSDPRLDPAATSCFARVVDSHLAAVKQLGMGTAWGETEDILITTAKAYLLIRLLGNGHYHWLAVSSEANLALCRMMMRSFEAFLLTGLADLGEIPED